MSATAITVGDPLPFLDTGTMTRHRIALYAHGSGDVNPIHVDSDFARDTAGLPDVIVHGMYTMGAMSRLVTTWGGPGCIRSIDTRFDAMVPAKASVRCSGVIVAIGPAEGGELVTIELAAVIGDGTRVASGSAVAYRPRSA